MDEGTSAVEQSATELPRREKLSYEEFVKSYLNANRPVVVADAMIEWPALSKWTPDFFRKEFGSRTTEIDGKSITLDEFIDQVEHATDDNPAPYLLATDAGGKLADQFPELMKDLGPFPPFIEPNWLAENYLIPSFTERAHRGAAWELFFGGRGAGYILHWDNLYFHAFSFQIYGEKEWVFYAPDQTPFLYPKADRWNLSKVNPFAPDLEEYPLFAKAKPIRYMAQPGDMLFAPCGWWHATKMHGMSISASVNTANASNWSRVATEIFKKLKRDKPLVAFPALLYLLSIKPMKSLRDRLRSGSRG